MAGDKEERYEEQIEQAGRQQAGRQTVGQAEMLAASLVLCA